MNRKVDVMNAILQRGGVSVLINPNFEGTKLPEHLLSEFTVRLDYGYGMVPPIPDLNVDEHGIEATLTFAGKYMRTFIPWGAVFAIAPLDGFTPDARWPEDAPKIEQKQEPSRPRLRLVN